jgi:putative membrane protein
MKIRYALLAAAFTGIAFTATASMAAGKFISDQDFVTKASVANKFEIDSSNIALEKSNNSSVKEFAQSMVDDHTKIGNDMDSALSSSKSGTKATMALDDEHQKLIDQLQSASGSDFDSKYITMQRNAHKKAIMLFNNYSQNGKDSSLRSFAENTLPVLKDHQTHLSQINIK